MAYKGITNLELLRLTLTLFVRFIVKVIQFNFYLIHPPVGIVYFEFSPVDTIALSLFTYKFSIGALDSIYRVKRINETRKPT